MAAIVTRALWWCTSAGRKGANMRVRVSVALLALALSAAAGSGRAWATSPKAGLTKGEAIRAFVDAANLVCIFTTVSHRSIEEAAGHADDDLVLADADDRKFSVAPKDHPMWVSKTAGNLVQVFADKNGVCTVTATQLPVQATFDAEAKLMRELGGSTYTERPFKPGYNPIGYEFVRTVEGDLVTIHMEGAEPGLPGHALRFSLLVLQVTRKAGGAP
jgi:hypothetical protein